MLVQKRRCAAAERPLPSPLPLPSFVFRRHPERSATRVAEGPATKPTARRSPAPFRHELCPCLSFCIPHESAAIFALAVAVAPEIGPGFSPDIKRPPHPCPCLCPRLFFAVILSGAQRAYPTPTREAPRRTRTCGRAGFHPAGGRSAAAGVTTNLPSSIPPPKTRQAPATTQTHKTRINTGDIYFQNLA
jgi:hypothetical protein